MTNKPVISLFGSGVRVDKWARLCESLSNNKTSYEIIIAGSNLPICDLPKNFHFIYTNVKPAQCSEIAVRYSKGDYVLNIADDEIFSEHFLDKMLFNFEKYCTEEDMISCMFRRNGIEYEQQNYQYWPQIKNSPMMPLNGLMKKSLWKKIGGIDKRFVALFWDLDIALRVLELGGKIIYSEDTWCEEMFDNTPIIKRITNKFFKKNHLSGLYQEFGKTIDRPLLGELWEKSTVNNLNKEEYYCKKANIFHMRNRNKEVDFFDDDYLLTVSQGRAGRW